MTDPTIYRSMSLADLLDAAVDAFEADGCSDIAALDKIEAADDSLCTYLDEDDANAQHVTDASNCLDDAKVALNGWSTRVDAIVHELRERARSMR